MKRDDDTGSGIGRRRYVAALGAGVLGGLAGCVGGRRSAGPITTAASGNATGTYVGSTDGSGNRSGTGPGVRPPSPGNVDLPVPKSELERGAGKNAIPAITRPAFGSDWSDVTPSLADDEKVIGVERGGTARAYPLAVLNWHEIVNDVFDGPLIVTYCPLCASGVTALRVVKDEATTFGVSGLLYRSNLVMYDVKTGSYWSQAIATAIRGEMTGTTLELVPSTLTTWKAWRASHPDSAVLLPPPESGTIVEANPRDYDINPYGGYFESRRIGIGNNKLADKRLHPKTQVIGVSDGNEAKAYPYGTVESEGVVNDTVGDLPVVVAAGPNETLYAYVRRVDGETLTFERASALRLRAGGSRWEVTTGRAVSGPHEGTRLEQASSGTTMFWFTWVDFHPETAIYGHEG